MILVSACLAGEKCAYDGEGRLDPKVKDLECIAVCPEVLGGRSVPRAKAEIRDGTGEDVLDGKAKVFDENGLDVTDQFIKGAFVALEIAKKYGVKETILKSRSPSCGVGKIYDGSFDKKVVDGDGVTAALFKKAGIQCRSI
ncbi:MAG: DUF523 domain-containing protein [Candidatus Omnitrophica bacterium]|nr:DUF523 domain-containing protein [Candidatus Omnitrophota bacterium]